jgi:hypothetical protein
MSTHVQDTMLALYVSGDVALWHRAAVRLHVGRCDQCRRRVERHRADLAGIREAAAWMPEGVDWNRLAPEMTANIHVGLAAGECVAPRLRKSIGFGWRPAAVAAAVAVLLAGAWWLNTPPAQSQSLGHALRSAWNAPGGGVRPAFTEDRGPVVEVTASGIELHENGNSFRVSQGTTTPLAVSMSVQGSASARYVDSDTGQMTITSVYVQ